MKVSGVREESEELSENEENGWEIQERRKTNKTSVNAVIL